MANLLATKPLKVILDEAHETGEHSLRRALGPNNLIALGIGAIIGTGIFVLAGTATAQYAGPAIVLSFVLAGAGCLFAGLCYAEFASLIPIAGSAYTYGYATLGEFFGWIIGWDLILEYLFAAGTVSVGWSGYFVAFLRDELHINLPAAITSAPLRSTGGMHFEATGAIINFPAVALVAILTTLLVLGIRESARVNNVIVIVKMA